MLELVDKTFGISRVSIEHATVDIDARGGGEKAVDAAIPLMPFIDLRDPVARRRLRSRGTRRRLRAYRRALPNEHAITLGADDGVAYDAVVQAMDSAAALGFTGLALSDT